MRNIMHYSYIYIVHICILNTFTYLLFCREIFLKAPPGGQLAGGEGAARGGESLLARPPPLNPPPLTSTSQYSLFFGD